MMKHELEKQLDALEKKGVDRRHFFKLLAATGLIAGANTGKANAFSSSAKGKIVIIGGGAAGISMAARLKHWLDEPDITLIDPTGIHSDRLRCIPTGRCLEEARGLYA